MVRLASLLAKALFVAGCAAIPPSPSPAASTAAVVATPTANPTATPPPTSPPTAIPTTEPTTEQDPTREPIPTSGSCPGDSNLTIALYLDSDLSCFGSTDVEFRGWLDYPSAIGFSPPGVKPKWLYFPSSNLSALWQVPPVGPENQCAEGFVCAYMFLHVDPASDVTLTGPPRWLIVNGHRDDPNAARCHYVYPEDWTEPHLDDAVAVATCRQSFVLTAVHDAP